MNGFTPRTPQDLSLIEKALADAQATTRGRINTVYGKDAGNLVYGLVSAGYALLAALIFIAIAFGFGQTGWEILIGQLAVAAIVFLGLFLTPWRVRLCPRALKRLFVNGAVRRHAVANGFTACRDAENDDPAILLLVLQREGFAQIVASPDAAKAIPKKVWRTLLDALLIDLGHGEIAKGLRNTVMACTKLLTVYFPLSKAKADADGAVDQGPATGGHGGHFGGNRLELV